MHYNTAQLQDHVLQSIYIYCAPSLPNTSYIQNTTYNAYYHYNMNTCSTAAQEFRNGRVQSCDGSAAE